MLRSIQRPAIYSFTKRFAMKTATARLDFPNVTVHSNLSTATLVEMALHRNEGVLAANGALCCDTGDRTGRSPNDKFVEDTPSIHDAIAWGSSNRRTKQHLFRHSCQCLLSSALGRRLLRSCRSSWRRRSIS